MPARRAGDAAATEERPVGFLATTAAGYAACMLELATMSRVQRLDIALAAREQAMRFSCASFKSAWLRATLPVLAAA